MIAFDNRLNFQEWRVILRHLCNTASHRYENNKRDLRQQFAYTSLRDAAYTKRHFTLRKTVADPSLRGSCL